MRIGADDDIMPAPAQAVGNNPWHLVLEIHSASIDLGFNEESRSIQPFLWTDTIVDE